MIFFKAHFFDLALEACLICLCTLLLVMYCTKTQWLAMDFRQPAGTGEDRGQHRHALDTVVFFFFAGRAAVRSAKHTLVG